MEAARERVAAGGHPIVEIMIPLTVGREEMALARKWVNESIAEVLAEGTKGTRAKSAAKGGTQPEVTIGTMIETPRAALRAAEIAEVADFFSFGTNDLTQMTFGFSRDDVEGRMMSAYLELGLLPRNPFETVDAAGVGSWSDSGRPGAGHPGGPEGRGLWRARGGPESIKVFYDAGLDYVSCSPFRVPVPGSPPPRRLLAAGDYVEPGPRHPKRAAPSHSAGLSATTGRWIEALRGCSARHTRALPSGHGLPDEDVAQVTGRDDIVAFDRRSTPRSVIRAVAGWGSARSTPKRPPRSASTPKRGF